MDSKLMENSDKAEFRKPIIDGGGRKYRKRSPVGGSSSSSDGSPHRERENSPASSRKNDKQNKDGGRDYASGRGGELHKHSDRQSSRNRDRHADDYDRGYSKPSYRSSRDSRDMRWGKDGRQRDYPNDEDKYRSRDKSTYDREGSGRRHGYVEERERSGRHLKETAHRDGGKELDSTKYANEDKKRYDDRSRHGREPEKHYEANNSFSSKDQISDSKKPKVSGWEAWDNAGPGTNGTSEKASGTTSDVDAAKVAAMKAAEQVNKNLVGTGFMSADQKKKLLWGNKKSTTTEEPAHRWNSAIFGDRERQEKFNKLMGVKGEPKVDQKLDDQNAEKQREQLQMELEKQYTAGLRRKDGRTVGLGL